MNIKPFFQQVSAAVKESQDGKTLGGDEYSTLLVALLKNNTETQEGAIDRGETDTENLATDLKYAIDQFTKALHAVEKFNK